MSWQKTLITLPIVSIFMHGCASTTPPPDWKVSSSIQLNKYGANLLEGDFEASKIAMEALRSIVSNTGDLQVAAKIEVARCGYLVAALEPPCEFNTEHNFYVYTSKNDHAYLKFLSGEWNSIDSSNLNSNYHGLLASKTPESELSAFLKMEDKISKLIAANVLLKRGNHSSQIIESAIKISSENGWRTPLLAWLNIALKRARDEEDLEKVKLLEQRILLILRGAAQVDEASVESTNHLSTF